jgi:hypothetical protein
LRWKFRENWDNGHGQSCFEEPFELGLFDNNRQSEGSTGHTAWKRYTGVRFFGTLKGKYAKLPLCS